MGIEPTLSAWKAEVLPLNYTRQTILYYQWYFTINGGGGRIRTSEGLSRQIYSLFPLTAREPLLTARKVYYRFSIQASSVKLSIIAIFIQLKLGTWLKLKFSVLVILRSMIYYNQSIFLIRKNNL